MEKIAIIIVNWNTGRLLGNCLRSFAQLPITEQALIESITVVDNASTDQSLATAQAVAVEIANPPVTFIAQSKNVGFARANNIVLKKMLARRVIPHVLLLNPDTEVKPGVLPALLQVFMERADVGIVGPKLTNPDGSLQGSVRPFPTFRDFVLYMLKLGRIVQGRQERAYNYTKPGYVDQVMGAAFLVRNTALKEVGLLDPHYFTLFEEVDFCRRARAAGWRTYFTPASDVMHVRAASFNQLTGFRRSWPWLVSSLHYARSHLGTLPWIILFAMAPLSLALTLPAMLKHAFLRRMAQERRI